MADTQVPDNFQLWTTCSTIVLGKLLKGRDVAALTDSKFDDFLRSKTPIDLFSQLFFLDVRLPGMDESAFDRKFGRLQESGDISVIRRQMVDLIEGIMGHEKPENIYSIVVEIFNTLSSYTPQLHASPTVSTLSDTINSQIISQVQTHWNTPLIGRDVERLLGKLHEYEKEFRSGVILRCHQSSGAGKSRLADEVGLYCPRVTYVIRAFRVVTMNKSAIPVGGMKYYVLMEKDHQTDLWYGFTIPQELVFFLPEYRQINHVMGPSPPIKVGIVITRLFLVERTQPIVGFVEECFNRLRLEGQRADDRDRKFVAAAKSL